MTSQVGQEVQAALNPKTGIVRAERSQVPCQASVVGMCLGLQANC